MCCTTVNYLVADQSKASKNSVPLFSEVPSTWDQSLRTWERHNILLFPNSGLGLYLDAAKRSAVPSPMPVVHHAEIVHLNGDRIGQNILRRKFPNQDFCFGHFFQWSLRISEIKIQKIFPKNSFSPKKMFLWFPQKSERNINPKILSSSSPFSSFRV